MLRKKWLLYVISLLVMVWLGSCGDRNEDPMNNGEVGPNETVDDPVGTISLSMRNASNGKTYLGSLYIGADDNFTGGWFVNLGPMKGLGNVTYIPVTGWAPQVAVTPGCGYIAYDEYEKMFIRIYVTDYVISTSGGVIGADVKYQKSFTGRDEAIISDAKTLTFGAEGGNQGVIFNNTSIIPFSIISSEPWCTATYASTEKYSFLSNAINIHVDGSMSTESSMAELVLKTLNDKETRIIVTRAGSQPFLVFNTNDVFISAEEQETSVGFSTNVSLDNIDVLASQSWLNVSLRDDIGRIYQNSGKIRSVAGKECSQLNYNSDVHSYVALLDVGANYEKVQRSAVVTLMADDLTGKFNVSQSALDFVFEGVDGEGQTVSALAGSLVIPVTSDIAESGFVVTSDTKWCNPSFATSRSYGFSLCIDYEANQTSKERVANICISSPDGEQVAGFSVKQAGASISIENADEGIVLEPTSLENMTLTVKSPFESSRLSASASESWITPSIDEEGNLTIKADYNPTVSDRNATITVSVSESDVQAIINVTQLKGYMRIKTGVDLNPDGKLFWRRYQYITTIEIETSFQNWEPKSSQSWCTLSTNGNNLTIRIPETTETRDVVISFLGTPCTLTIKQLKYTYGDTYDLEGLLNEGMLIAIDEFTGEGVVARQLEGQYVWSTENVETGANDRYDGQKNMDIIMKIPNWETIYPAFSAVNDLNQGTTGWYIPASLEGQNKNWVCGRYAPFWTSTEVNESYVYYSYDGRCATAAAWTWRKRLTVQNRETINLVAVRKIQF